MRIDRWGILEKAFRVVASCETLEQLEVASRYYKRAKWYSTFRLGAKDMINNLTAYNENSDIIEKQRNKIWGQIRLNAM